MSSIHYIWFVKEAILDILMYHKSIIVKIKQSNMYYKYGKIKNKKVLKIWEKVTMWYKRCTTWQQNFPDD